MKANNPVHDFSRAESKSRINGWRRNDIILFGDGLKTDRDRDKRRFKQLCPICYYGPPVVAGQAFTSADCGGCGREMQFSSTAVDALCRECAVKRECCVFCGAQIDLKVPDKSLFQ